MQVAAQADDDHAENAPYDPPNSPPPSFRSRASSPNSRHNTTSAEADATLADAFDADGSDSEEENDGDDRQRLMRGTPSTSSEQLQVTESTAGRPQIIERRVTHIPVFSQSVAGRVYGGGSGSDGVFANLNAKPESGEKVEEHPPVRLLPLFWNT